MIENEITFAEFWNIVTNASLIEVTEGPSTELPWDGERIEAYILNQEESGHSDLHYYKEPFDVPVFYLEVRLREKRVFLFKVTAYGE